jgi:hypothetical protein
LDNAAFVLCTEFFRENLRVPNNTKGYLTVVPDVVYFSTLKGTVEKYALIN